MFSFKCGPRVNKADQETVKIIEITWDIQHVIKYRRRGRNAWSMLLNLYAFYTRHTVRVICEILKTLALCLTLRYKDNYIKVFYNKVTAYTKYKDMTAY